MEIEFYIEYIFLKKGGNPTDLICEQLRKQNIWMLKKEKKGAGTSARVGDLSVVASAIDKKGSELRSCLPVCAKLRVSDRDEAQTEGEEW